MTNHWPVKGDPREHQARALDEAGLKPAHAFWMDPGAGKTFTCIAEAGRLFLDGKIDGVLIIAPNGPHEQWIDEQFPLWADFEWTGATNRMTPLKLSEWFASTTAQKAQGKMIVGALNYDALPYAVGKRFLEKFFKAAPRFYLVIDESQKIKNYKAARTKQTIKIARKAAYRRTLSGTPILKGLEDLFTQYDALEKGLTGFTSGLAFNQYFCELRPVPGVRPIRGYQPMRIVGYRNEEELREITKPYATRITSSEFMTLEEPTFMNVRAPMAPDQEKAYITMAKLMLSQIKDGTITASNALVQLGKLQQIASGFLYLEEGSEEYQWFGNNKIDATVELLEQLDEPVIVWTPFRALQKQLLIALEALEGYDQPVYLYDGSREMLDKWKQTGGVMIGNQGSGLGVGQNLQNAAAMIYVANTFASEHRWQSVRRTYRLGQDRPVRVWDLVAPNTVDVKALASLGEKEDVAKSNIDTLKEALSLS